MAGAARATERLPFLPEEHDLRVEREGCVFWIRGVKRGQPLRWDPDADTSGLVEFILSLVLGLVLHLWWQRQTRWKVGVVRIRSTGWGWVRVMHRELLPPGEEPPARIAELAAKVEAGAFDPR